jgi:dipeptidyl-peptidase-3
MEQSTFCFELCFWPSLTIIQLRDHIYSTTPEASLYIGKRSLGHISNYYVGEVTSDEEVTAIQAAAEKLNIDIMNTRYVQRAYCMLSDLYVEFSVAKNGPSDYALRIASANPAPSATHEIDVRGKKCRLRVEYGDFSAALTKANNALRQVWLLLPFSLYNTHFAQAKEHVANQHQSNMIEGYIKSHVPLF